MTTPTDTPAERPKSAAYELMEKIKARAPTQNSTGKAAEEIVDGIKARIEALFWFTLTDSALYPKTVRDRIKAIRHGGSFDGLRAWLDQHAGPKGFQWDYDRIAVTDPSVAFWFSARWM